MTSSLFPRVCNTPRVFAPRPAASCLAALAGILALTGCAGVSTLPDTAVPGATVQPGAIHGSLLGGHAPIIGAHIYVFEVGKTGYASAATSELTTGDGTDTHGTYVITDATGSFNITGDYSCDINEPVYLAAVGGSSTANPTLNITSATFTETGNSGKYTITFHATNSLTNGANVTFFGLTGGYAQLNGSTFAVSAPSSNSFTVSFTGGHGSISGSTTGTAVYGVNPAIINLATLGPCPGSSGEFANSLSYVYIDEVSTVATAYAFAGFGSGPYNIGSSSTNLAGIKNAAFNAQQLFNIQNPGQVANSVTSGGNGTVPNTTINTLGNILSSCVDSSGSSSAQCTTLFKYATSTGATTGTQPTDTATAIFNIAKYPEGNGSSSFMSQIYALQSSGPAPYSPALTAQPNDFTIAVTYTNITSPGSIAIDANGNAFVPTNSSSAGYVTELSPQGAVLNTSATGGKGFDSIAIDSGGNVFVAAQTSNALYAYTNTLGPVTNSPFASISGIGPTSVVVDSSANNNLVYLTGSNNSNQIIQVFSNNAAASPTVAAQSSASYISNSCLAHVNYITLDTKNDFWAGIGSSNSVCRITNTGTQVFSDGGYSGPTNVAIDSYGNGWFGVGQQTNLIRASATGAATAYGVINNNAQGGISSPNWVAIDGNDNVWVTNKGNSFALSEFSNNGTTSAAITNTSGYQGGSLDNPSFLAIDFSGDLWIPNQNGNSVTEFIGIAGPVSTPLSNLTPGTRP